MDPHYLNWLEIYSDKHPLDKPTNAETWAAAKNNYLIPEPVRCDCGRKPEIIITAETGSDKSVAWNCRVCCCCSNSTTDYVLQYTIIDAITFWNKIYTRENDGHVKASL